MQTPHEALVLRNRIGSAALDFRSVYQSVGVEIETEATPEQIARIEQMIAAADTQHPDPVREARSFVRGDRVKGGNVGTGTVVEPTNSAGNVGVYWDAKRLAVVEWPQARLLTLVADDADLVGEIASLRAALADPSLGRAQVNWASDLNEALNALVLLDVAAKTALQGENTRAACAIAERVLKKHGRLS